MSETEQFIEQLKKDRYSRINQPLDTKQAILLQKELNDNEFATIPDSFMQILHVSNGISCNSSVVLGSFEQDPLKDIVSQNIRFDTDKNTLLLGISEMDLFVYKPQNKVYQIIDREDMEVLDEYDEDKLLKALSAFLKISYE